MTATPSKITFGEMRASGVRDVLIYCRDHSAATTSKSAPTAGRTTSGCRTSNRASPAPPAANVGAEIRPAFGQARMGTG
jgi:hypothetical protein